MRGAGAPLVLALLVTLGLAAPWIAPAPPHLQEDVAGAKLLPPMTRAFAIRLENGRTWIVTGLRRIGDDWEGRRAGRIVRVNVSRAAGSPESRVYLLGTDILGRDLASRLLHALRYSLLVATIAVAVAIALGVTVGSVSGLAGGLTDGLLMRGVDVLLSVPRLLLFLLLAALFRPSTLLLLVVLGGTTWPGLARLVRGEIAARRKSDLAGAARAVGCTKVRTAVLHLLPQAAPVIAVTAALRFADTILLESAVSFLGLGAPPPAVSLGSILASGRESLADGWWVAAWPVALLAALVMSVRSLVAGVFGDPPSVA